MQTKLQLATAGTVPEEGVRNKDWNKQEKSNHRILYLSHRVFSSKFSIALHFLHTSFPIIVITQKYLLCSNIMKWFWDCSYNCDVWPKTVSYDISKSPKGDDSELERIHNPVIIHSYGKDDTKAQQSTLVVVLSQHFYVGKNNS